MQGQDRQGWRHEDRQVRPWQMGGSAGPYFYRYEMLRYTFGQGNVFNRSCRYNADISSACVTQKFFPYVFPLDSIRRQHQETWIDTWSLEKCMSQHKKIRGITPRFAYRRVQVLPLRQCRIILILIGGDDLQWIKATRREDVSCQPFANRWRKAIML